MKKLEKGCRALIVALIMAVCCNFIAFGDEVAAPESAVESVMDDTTDASVSESIDSEVDEAADADSNSEPDGSEADEAAEPEEKKDDDQSSFDSGNKEDHSSFDEWDFPEPQPTPEPEKPEPAPEPQPQPEPEPEKPEPAPEPEKPEIPVTPAPEPTPVTPVAPEPTPEPERWHDDSDDDDDDIVVVIPKKPVFTAETDMVPVVKTFEVSSGDTLPTPEETPALKTEIPKTPSSDLPKTGDSSLALYAFMASAFGLAVLLGSSFIDRHNADETAKEFSTYPQMCCGPQETEKTGKDVSVKAVRSSGTKIAPSRFGLRCKSCIEIVLALTHPGWGLFVSKSR